MPKQRLKSPRARLFIALDLPEALREAIVSWQRAELTDEALRIMPPQNLHITLAFLGLVPEKAIPRLAELVHDLEAPAPLLRLQRDPAAKPKSRPKLFALEAPSSAADGFAGQLGGPARRGAAL